jgi:hypothetical protein
MAYALAAIAALGLVAALGWYLLGEIKKVCGKLIEENNSLREGAEVRSRVDRILAESVASGGRLRARLLARALRGLPESSQHGGTSAPTGTEPAGG